MKSRPRRTREDLPNREPAESRMRRMDDRELERKLYSSSSTPRKFGWFFIVIGMMFLGGVVLKITAGPVEWPVTIIMAAFAAFWLFFGLKIVTARNTVKEELEAAELEMEQENTDRDSLPERKTDWRAH